MHIPKWLIATTGLLVLVLVAAIAFYIGRDSARSRATEATSEEAPREQPTGGEPASAETVPGPAPTSSVAPIPAPVSEAINPAIIPSTASAPGRSTDSLAVSDESRARVAAYFTQIAALQAGGSTGGNQEEFAQALVNAAMSGNFAGIDDLVQSAGDIERRALAVQPPSECAEYHQMVVSLLHDSRAMVATMRDGLKRGDVNALAAMGATAESMKARADSVAATEKALRARFGL